MNEAETRAELIDPALREAGWGVVEESRIRREVIAPGRLRGGGRRSKAEIADYVLVYRNRKLAVIEAKKRSLSASEGVAQAKAYAKRLRIRFTFATNGEAIYRIDMESGAEGPVERFPTPEELWALTFSRPDPWRDRFAAVPFEDRGGSWEPRYYQHNAVERTLEAIAEGRDRILLTLATGTGKTAIAFQIAWKLFHSRWSVKAWRDGGEPGRRPRILFLADRNILADQAYNAFSAFPEDALVRIAPDEIRKRGRVPKNSNLFFTIFQTFMSGRDEEGRPSPWFGDYPADFFDFIVIDECHRGGANDESTWRAILEYFAPAVQLGLTATPKRDANVDTYRYFGEPVYVYSLKEGINDGYLTPFKVRQIATTLDDYVYTSDDTVVEGEVEVGKRYGEEDFNRIIEIEERERYRVKVFLEMIDQREKSLVFCANQEHAAAVRNLINQLSSSRDPFYCVRVTANDGERGEQFLRTFQDNEKSIPTILTTAQKLSTGVDARNIRNIILLRPINAMIEFKQIIGRGTRLFDGKDYFTIYDFVKAYEHFNDEAWDGEPVEPEPCGKCGGYPCTCAKEPPKPCPVCGEHPCICEREPLEPCPKCWEYPCICNRLKRVKIKLADGKERTLQHIAVTTFWGPDGQPLSAAEFVERLFGDLPELFRDEDELRALWSRPDTREGLLEALAEKGYELDQLEEIKRVIDAEKSDIFDVLSYIAFALPPMTREERVERNGQRIFPHYDYKQQTFIRFVLSRYVEEGVGTLSVEALPDLVKLNYHGVSDAAAEFGDMAMIRELFVGFQQYLYHDNP